MNTEPISVANTIPCEWYDIEQPVKLGVSNDRGAVQTCAAAQVGYSFRRILSVHVCRSVTSSFGGMTPGL